MTDHSAKPVGRVRYACKRDVWDCQHPECAPVVEPHVHEPAGPGEYCTGCFDQGAVWALHEERARIIAIIERENEWYAPALLAAIEEHR
jgi:hypothetical protein